MTLLNKKDFVSIMPKTTPYCVKDFPKKPKNLKKPKKVRWAMDEPKRQERISMFKKCPKCILVPPERGDDKSDPMNYKFPVCTKLGKTKGKCQFNCKGLLAANRRARLTKKYPKVVALTSKLINKWQCTKKAEKEAMAKSKVKTPVKAKKPLKVVKKKTPMKVVKKVKTKAKTIKKTKTIVKKVTKPKKQTRKNQVRPKPKRPIQKKKVVSMKKKR